MPLQEKTVFITFSFISGPDMFHIIYISRHFISVVTQWYVKYSECVFIFDKQDKRYQQYLSANLYSS